MKIIKLALIAVIGLAFLFVSCEREFDTNNISSKIHESKGNDNDQGENEGNGKKPPVVEPPVVHPPEENDTLDRTKWHGIAGYVDYILEFNSGNWIINPSTHFSNTPTTQKGKYSISDGLLILTLDEDQGKGGGRLFYGKDSFSGTFLSENRLVFNMTDEEGLISVLFIKDNGNHIPHDILDGTKWHDILTNVGYFLEFNFPYWTLAPSNFFSSTQTGTYNINNNLIIMTLDGGKGILQGRGPFSGTFLSESKLTINADNGGILFFK